MNTASARTPSLNTPSEAGAMLRPTLPKPRTGWRAVAYRWSRGAWNPGLSDREQKQRDRETQIATQLRGKHVTAFFCLKGGISKTSTTAAVSTALANLRPDPVFAIDANPDAGDLAERLVGEQLAGITALSRHIDQVQSLEDLSRYTVTSGRLTVLPGEPNPVLGDSLSSTDFERILHTVQRFYSNVQVDCGTGVTHPLMSGILRYTSTAVIPAAWSVTGARRAMETIAWLRDNGFSHLADSCIVVLTAKDIVSKSVDKDAVQRHLASGSELFVVPADPHMADGGQMDWEQLKPRTQEAFLDIAEAITRRFARDDDEAQHWPLKQPSRGTHRAPVAENGDGGRQSESVAAGAAAETAGASATSNASKASAEQTRAGIAAATEVMHASERASAEATTAAARRDANGARSNVG